MFDFLRKARRFLMLVVLAYLPVALLSFTPSVFAACDPATQISFDSSGLICASVSTPTDLINNLGIIAAGLGIFTTIVMVVIGSYKLMQSGGDQNKVKDAREQITNALMGMVLILLAAFIVKTAFNAVGISN